MSLRNADHRLNDGCRPSPFDVVGGGVSSARRLAAPARLVLIAPLNDLKLPFRTMVTSAGSGNVRDDDTYRKEEQTMRYALALAMALGLGIASMVPAAHASDNVDRPIYRNGHVVLQNAVPVYLATGSASSTVAGSMPTTSDPYQEQRYDNWGR